MCGDVHPRSGPSQENSLTFCHWKLDSIAVNNFIKIPLIEASNSMNYDLIALSEAYLHSSITWIKLCKQILPGGVSVSILDKNHPLKSWVWILPELPNFSKFSWSLSVSAVITRHHWSLTCFSEETFRSDDLENSVVPKSYPKGEDDLEFSTDSFHKKVVGQQLINTCWFHFWLRIEKTILGKSNFWHALFWALAIAT